MYVSLYECFNLLLYIFPTFSIVESNESSTVVIYECFVAHPAIGNDVESWLVDTGVITHVIAQDKLMSKIENVIVKVFVGNGTKIPCIKQGELRPTDEKGVLLYQVVIFWHHLLEKSTFLVMYAILMQSSTHARRISSGVCSNQNLNSSIFIVVSSIVPWDLILSSCNQISSFEVSQL